MNTRFRTLFFCMKLLKIVPMLVSHFADQQDIWELLQPGSCSRDLSALLWQGVERLVHIKELHQRNSCWECKNTGRKELLLSIYAFSGRGRSIAASCFFIIIHGPLSPLGQGLCRNPVHPTKLWMHFPVHLMCLSHANVYRCLPAFKKLISIVLSFRRWPLQEKTKYRKS